MKLMGSNFLPTLREFMDDSVIPAYLGGSKMDDEGVFLVQREGTSSITTVGGAVRGMMSV